MTEAGLVALIVGSGGMGWIGSAVVEYIKNRGNSRSAGRDADLRLEEHRDELTFRLLEAARVEVADLRREIQRLRPMENHLLHFDEALMHVERLLVVPSSSENRAQIEREARAFLSRIAEQKSFASGTRRSIQTPGTE